MNILSIETSCDETAISLVSFTQNDATIEYSVLGDTLNSQAALHSEYGGVYPNLAKREHAKNLTPILIQTLQQASDYTLIEQPSDKIDPFYTELFAKEPELAALFIEKVLPIKCPTIDYIAVTHGPGLEPALWVGVNFAKALSHLWDIPVIPVNHMEGHILAALCNTENTALTIPELPILSLLVSGGHTELVLMEEWLSYTKLGGTRDDAVGEAFDKVARMLGLAYPGGPVISQIAQKAREQGISPKYKLPRPMLNSDDLDFSFSGIKTAVLYLVKKIPELTQEDISHIALEFENAAIEVLVKKTLSAVDHYGPQTIVVGGGVSANTHLRATLTEAIKQQHPHISVHIPQTNLSTDNAIMIALSGYFRATDAQVEKNNESIVAQGNLRIAN